MTTEYPDVQGKALLDYYLGKEKVRLKLHTSYGPPEKMPVEVFFREKEDFSKLERMALRECRGKVLDIGAGAGSFALELQEQGLEVCAMEVSPLSCHIMQQRRVGWVEEQDIWQYGGQRFDTLLLMMNGLGLAGTLDRLPTFMQKLKSLLLPGGQIICDSSDITYLYLGLLKPEGRYYGEIDYQYEYEGLQGQKFSWLYVDEHTLTISLAPLGLKVEVLYKNRTDQYLARITVNN
ncbi:class I SAM-dependent methyltransferase [Nafulsella turpanensis]|uniref:class I SAM-dependent methyltransferase n=1 Tax=Nafulsella turpanensis TaxID=1265690 RepID=UPI00034CF112|nr:methyltransferase domain-containing protein [Nafulsella turpanensis]